MLHYCEQIEGTLERFNHDKELFCSDYVFFNACNMCIIQIGELVSDLPHSFTPLFHFPTLHSLFHLLLKERDLWTPLSSAVKI